MTSPTPQAPAREAVELPELPKPKRFFGHSTMAPMWDTEEMRAYAIESRADLKEGDDMLREIGVHLSAQSEFTGSYAEIVVKMLSALAAKQEELDKMRRIAELVIHAADNRAAKDWALMNVDLSEAAELARAALTQGETK
jgi:hypothetical protein